MGGGRGASGGGGGVRVDVNGEVKFLRKFQKKKFFEKVGGIIKILKKGGV